MHKLLKYIIFSCWILLLPTSTNAQGKSLKLRGKVISKTSVPLANVMVSINGSKQALSNPSGEFELSSTDNKVKFVNAEKDGLIIKDWEVRNNNLEIVMVPPTIITGRVFSDKSVPVANVNVLAIGVRGTKASKTDETGKFTLTVPEGTRLGQSSFAVYGKPFVNGKANYTLEILSDSKVNIFVELPPQLVRRVRILDKKDKPLSGKNVQIAGVGAFQTNNQGIANISGNATNFSKYRIAGYRITHLEYQSEGDQMNIKVVQLLAGENEDENAISIIDGKQAEVDAEQYFLVREENKVADEKSKIEARLKENISAEERAKLRQRLSELDNKLTNIRKRTEVARERAEKVIDELQKLSIGLGKKDEEIKQKDATIAANKKTIAQSKKEAKLAKQVAFQNYIIFAIVALALLSIVFIIYRNSHETKKQRNELAEANQQLGQVNKDIEKSNHKLANLNYKLNDSNEQLKDKIEEVNSQKEMLETSAKMMDRKNNEIRNKNEVLTRQTEEIQVKNEELEEYNRNLTSSIRYAQAIQNSILPSSELISANLSEHFIVYLPKDIVSGDFYWFAQKGDDMIAVAADCTGHGVPGAFMTMMGNTLLNQIVNEANLTDPAKILTLLNIRVKETLKQHEQNTERAGDGMDVCVLKINKRRQKAIFAGAKSSLFFVRPEDKEIQYLRGSNLSVGSTLKSANKTFENHFIDLQGNETFYLTSDGFQDQAGIQETAQGNRRKKYLKTRFMDLLYECSKLPMPTQTQRIKQEFEDWKGSLPQTDDIIIFGLKV